MSKLMCPYCGWTYDPSINGDGYDLVPNHWYKAEDCPGQQQHPRNADSDKRPLWRDEQETKMLDAAINLANSHEQQLHEIAIAFGKDARGYGSIAEMVRQELDKLLIQVGCPHCGPHCDLLPAKVKS